MLDWLWLLPALPFAGFLVLALAGPRLPRGAVAAIGVGSVGLAAALAALVAASFLASPPPNYAFAQTLWTWLDVGGRTAGITLYLDALSLAFVLIVTFVGFLIHLYAAEFMAGEEGYSRFFAYMNLFVGSMLLLVLAADLLFLLLGWEGVGLCSYLLIGFWYRDPANGRAARKAFVVTRVGDVALLVGLFVLFRGLGTLNVQAVVQEAPLRWAVGAPVALAAAALILGGAVGKSAQLPLQTWLPDAMAGPTPVSALIHAATMVTAGVYLIARLHALFTLAPAVMLAVALVGAATMLLAGFSALAQWDIKRVLAYSTISQIGLMFLALGVGAWTAAVFHFITHAFFKALLFLGAGSLSLALHHTYDLARMGGLRRAMPLTFWTFLVGAASLAALPFVTAGFYSKDAILAATWAAAPGGPALWAAGVLAAFLTSLYTFRMVFLAFFGPRREEPTRGPALRMQISMVVLAFFALTAGFLDVPQLGFTPLSQFLGTALPATVPHLGGNVEWTLLLVTTAVSLLGVYLAYVMFLRAPAWVRGLLGAPWAAAPEGRPCGAALHRLWRAGWGFDWLYDRLLVRPFVSLVVAARDDPLDLFYQGVARTAVALHRGLGGTVTGRVRRYALGIAAGAALVVAVGALGVWLS